MEARSTHAAIRPAVAELAHVSQRLALTGLVVALLLVLGSLLAAPAAIAGPPGHAQASDTAREATASSDAEQPAEDERQGDAGGPAEGREPAQGEGPPTHAPAHGTQDDPPPAEHAPAHGTRNEAPTPSEPGQGEEPGDETGESAGTPNRGSLKVRSVGEETFPPAYEPHPGCEVWLHFHGFDAGERDLRISAWAPTGDQQVVYEGTVDLEQARGNAYSGIYPTDGPLTLDALTADTSWPDEYEPHAQQGWHLRVEVDGPKHKMFWLDCPAANSDDDTDDQNADDETDEGSSGTPSTLDDQAPATTDDQVLGLILDRPEPDDDSEVFGIGGAEPQPLDIATADRDVEVMGQVIEADGTLPITGANLAWLAAVGLLVAVAGARLVAVGRQPR